MNRLLVFALAGLGFVGLSVSSAQAAGWHRTYCRPVCPPVVACSVPTPVVAAAPAVCTPAACAPAVNCYPAVRVSYYNRFSCGRRVHSWHWCR
jgi:hypothetical protein